MGPEIGGLRCEYLPEPYGVDCAAPRFCWQLRHPGRGQVQTAWQVLVASAPALLAPEKADLWNSGQAAGGESLHVPYAGGPLQSMRRYWWTVRAADAGGTWSAWAAPASFVTGVMNPAEWKARWLGFAGGANGFGLLARRQFVLAEGIREAFACVCGLGWHQLRLNGRPVEGRLLEPPVTDYTKRVLYSTYDVSEYLRPGENVAGFVLGNGWHGAPRFLMQMVVRYENGRRQLVVSDLDSGWQLSRGPLGLNSIFDGECYDARLEKPGWDSPGYAFAQDDRVKGGWLHAMALEAPGGQLAPHLVEPVQVVETLPLVKLRDLDGHTAVYDAGRNIAGIVALAGEGEAGAAVTLLHGESLYEDGRVNRENLRTAQAADTYIFKGGGRESWQPLFTYHGFRYVQVETRGRVRLHSLQALRIRNGVARTGQFACSDATLNGIETLVVNTEEANLHGVPTDCPQRDERMGWLNDATVRAEEAIYHFGLGPFLEKWMWDIRDTQGADGSITDTAPFRFGTRPADPVCTSFLLIPWLLYLHYGDTGCLAAHYPAMQRWVAYLAGMAKGHIIEYSRFGDWASPRSESEDTAFGSGARSATTPGAFVSTCYYYYDLLLLQKYARLLGKPGDGQQYEAEAQKVLAAIRQKWYNAETGRFALGSQGSQALALRLNLAPPEHRPKVLRALVGEVERHGGHLSTGNQTTKFLLECLSDEGLGALAVGIATRPGYPGWAHMLAGGATTLWERWEYETGKEMNSHNHPMHGALGAWFFRNLAGIRPSEAHPGFAKVALRPDFASGLNGAEARLETLRGPVAFTWHSKGGGLLVLAAEIPPTACAVLYLPPCAEVDEGQAPLWRAGQGLPVPGVSRVRQEESGGLAVEFGSGKYRFTCRGVRL